MIMGRTASVRRRAAGALAVAATAAVLATAAPAGASPPGHDNVRADGLASPLSIDVTQRGDVLVAQTFAGGILSVPKKGGKGGAPSVVVDDPLPIAVGAGPFGTVVYTTASEGSPLLKVKLPNGSTRTLADLGQFEATENPDAGNSYGFEEIPDECAAQWPVDEAGPPQYEGQVDSNPYALLVTLFGVYVADAGGNAINFVDWSGHVRNVAVLPPQELYIPEGISIPGLPDCIGGLTYRFEPVPTDVEMGRRGVLVVSLLPGGPEDDSLGARGSVVEVNSRSGASSPLGGGFLGATDVAVSPNGDIYVTELFGNRVSRLTPTGPETVAELPMPAAVEWAKGRLYVAYDVFGSGKLATLRP
jgi:hypothetical protein